MKMNRQEQLEYNKKYRALFTKVGLRRGNVYEHLDREIIDWLVDEAIKVKTDTTGIIIASIIKDAYFEEIGEKNVTKKCESRQGLEVSFKK